MIIVSTNMKRGCIYAFEKRSHNMLIQSAYNPIVRMRPYYQHMKKVRGNSNDNIKNTSISFSVSTNFRLELQSRLLERYLFIGLWSREKRGGVIEEKKREHGSNIARLETAIELKSTVEAQSLQQTALQAPGKNQSTRCTLVKEYNLVKKIQVTCLGTGQLKLWEYNPTNYLFRGKLKSTMLADEADNAGQKKKCSEVRWTYRCACYTSPMT